MTFAFDLISDLHVDTYPGVFNWDHQATSPFCVIVGDIAQDRELLVDTLTKIAKCYQGAFFIDGNGEHELYYEDLGGSYEDLIRRTKNIPNLVYLQDNVVVINGVAILGTNAWWDYEFDPGVDAGKCIAEWCERCGCGPEVASNIASLAATDANYLGRSVSRLQKHFDVKHIVIVTHTVPQLKLISHDIGFTGTTKINCMGNRALDAVLDQDTMNKIHTWCFGHYHGSVDQMHRGVRFTNNCRGKAKTDYAKSVFYPKRIEIQT